MITGCLSIFLILIAISAVIVVGIFVLPFIAGVYFVLSYLMYSRSKNLEASTMECPNCGSRDIKIQSVTTGVETNSSLNGSGTTFLGVGHVWGNRNSRTNYKQKREGVCQSCGFNYDYLTDEDVTKTKNSSKLNLIVSIILLIVSILILIGFLGRSKNNNSDNSSIWANEITAIDSFEYYLDGNNVYLKKYIGKDKKVRIASSYTIDGKEYVISSFAGRVFDGSSIDSVILPEGLVTMPKDTFSGCRLKNIYIPSTLQTSDDGYKFYKYLYNTEKIYYGGTEEQWKTLTNNANRADIDVVEIIYNVNPNDLNN